MWNQKDTMDAGRFILHQAGWEDKSALGRYNSGHASDFRVGGAYGGRGYPDPGFPGENGYPGGNFHRDMLVDRDRYQMAPPLIGNWPPSRGNVYEEDIGVMRGPQRHMKAAYGDAYRDVPGLRDSGDGYREGTAFREAENFDNFREQDNIGERDFDRCGRYFDSHRQSFDGDDHSYKRLAAKGSREGSWDRDYGHSRYDDAYDSDRERSRKNWNTRKQRKRDKEKRRSKERDKSPERGRHRERSGSRSQSPSHSRSHSRSRSRSRSHSRGSHDYRSRKSRSSSRGYARDKRERSHEDGQGSHGDRRRGRDDRRHRDHNAPSATLVVKGLSQRTIEDDIYQALTEWGPLRHVRVIKERSTGTSRGFAFVDFPTVEAARKMMDDVGDHGLVVDGRRLFFEYSSKPTGGVGGPQVDANTTNGGAAASAVDWMCLICGCVNFARRTSCFQCNEARTDDAPSADVSAAGSSGKKGSEAGPTHVLVVRGLDENVNEEILHYEFSKYAPLKDLRLVRDKFTHISKGFAFAHFHSVEDATKALEASNGITLEKNGQPLRVAYAKSTYGPGISSSSNIQTSNSLAAAAIEAANFAQQYDAVGWAPKEYNPDQVKDSGTNDSSTVDANAGTQSGFVWDEASGYYYDAASGFYYDGHRGLYYDGNHGIWYTYNQETQQYELYPGQEVDGNNTSVTGTTVGTAVNNQSASIKMNATVKSKDATTVRKAVISAPPVTISVDQEAKIGIPEAVNAAAAAANAAMKKDKSRKALLTSSKTKISGVSAMWKHNEGAQSIHLDQSLSKTSSTDEKAKSLPTKVSAANVVMSSSVTPSAAPKKIQGVIHTKQTVNRAVSDESLSIYKSSVTTSSLGVNSSVKKFEGVIHSRDEMGAGLTKKFEGVIHSRDEAGGLGSTALKKLEGVMHSRDGAGFSSQLLGNSYGGNRLSEDIVGARHPTNNLHEDVTPRKGDAPPVGGRRRFTEAPRSLS
ncbi:hypothetical protein KP509_22G052600 [Ceratopteris richardii]|uniref:SUPPRESSOR OF ABI3-5 n=1 Tax=Ceratopteris richardii TaxID=49495 RepID=A0A8T2S8G0_CERRI|nr:hypothetical protein KP509_22G052600 [Ceratopteris richardii]